MTVAGFSSREERNRLAQFYAALRDGELQELARESGSLTDEARAALTLEMSRRKMTAETPGEAGNSAGPDRRA
jgi:hypothetical protein